MLCLYGGCTRHPDELDGEEREYVLDMAKAFLERDMKTPRLI